MSDKTDGPSHFDRGLLSGFDDAWHEEWWRMMDELGGNIISALRMRMVASEPDRVVMEMAMGPSVRQGTGVFAAGALIQLADVGATTICFNRMRQEAGSPDEPLPFPLSCRSAPTSSETLTAGR